MTDEKLDDNPLGQEPPKDTPPTMANVTQFATAFVGPVMAAAINGCLKSLNQFNLEFLLVMISMCFGRCMGQVLSIGDKIQVSQLRKKCIDAFAEELRKVPINPLPAHLKPSETAMPPDQKELLDKIKRQTS